MNVPVSRRYTKRLTFAHLFAGVRLAVETLVDHRLRSSLVILGVSISVATAMGMVAILSGFGQKITNEVKGGDVPIYSVTRSNPGGRLGFLQERRRLNVALSRGRIGLVIVGDDQFAATAEGDNPFAAVLRHIHRDPRCCVDEARP